MAARKRHVLVGDNVVLGNADHCEAKAVCQFGEAGLIGTSNRALPILHHRAGLNHVGHCE